MKKIITLILLSLFVDQGIHAQTYLPVATTGYSLDAVAENTTALATTSGALDGGGNVFYSQAYGAIVSSLYGLPNSGILSSGTRTYQLQSYTTSNALYLPISGQADTLNLVTPAAFSNLSLLGFATEADGTMSVTVRFTDNSSQVFSGITVYDWFNAATPFASGFDRLARATGVLENVGAAGNPRFFTHDLAILCANQNKSVKRIIIKNTSVSSKICMWAVAGVSLPLTASAVPSGLCNSGTATITAAAGASTFTWLPVGNFAGSTASNVAVTPTVTTEYTLQTITPQNCTVNAMVTVNVYSVVPTLTITNTANAGGVCPNSTVALTASGATTYTWTGGSSTVINGAVFSPTIASDYTVTAGNACGTMTAATSVSVHPFPNITPVASSASLCSGLNLTLTGVGNSTAYVWSGGSGAITNGVGFAPSTTATYTVIGTSALSCTASATIPVTVVTTPVNFPTQNTGIVCIGGSSTLTATGATNYTWTSATQTVFTSSFVVTPNIGTTTYTVTKSNANCFDTKTISVVTNSLPTIFAIVNPTLVCALNPATLAVGGGQSYTWTAPGTPNFTFTGSTPVVSPPVSSIYTVAASDGTCISTTTVFLAANPNPTITTTVSSPSICSGHSVTVSANGGINYTWTASTGTFYTQSVTDAPTIATAYNVTGDNSFGCITGASTVVLVNPNPVIAASASKILVCSGNPSTLYASGANSYTWDANANGALTSSTIVNPISPTSATMIYTVQGSNSFPCQGSQTVQVSVFVPTLTVSGNTNTCSGGVTQLNASGGNMNTYAWYTTIGGSPYSFQTLNATVTAAAVYTVNAMTSTLTVVCPATQTVAVGVYYNPTITATPQRTLICTKESVNLYGGGGVSYSWSNGAPGGTITVSPINNTTYTVTGTDANGCVGTGTVLVKISGCAGINELSNTNNELVIYPNPNNGEFTIKANGNMDLTLVNELGEVVRNINLLQENEYKVSLLDLAEGIYFLSGKTDTYSFSRKIMVIK